MKKLNKIGLLIIILIFSFMFRINEVFAVNVVQSDTGSSLPTCNINTAGSSSVGYGYITAHYIDAGLASGGPEILGDDWIGWSEKRESKSDIIIDSSRKLKSWSLTFYHDKDSKHSEPYAMCKITNKDIPDNTKEGAKRVTIGYSFTSGHILNIKVDVSDTKKSKSRTLRIGKKIGDTGSVSNSNSTTVKATEARTGTNPAITKKQASDITVLVNFSSGKSSGSIECNKDDKNSLFYLISHYWSTLMILVPVALIILVTIDFIKPIVSSDADALKKAGNNAVKRTVAAFILLMLPVILRLILGWFGLELCL